MTHESTLSERLRTETKAAHTAAERSGIMQHLLRGTIDEHDYVRLLRNLEVLYEALESGLARQAHHPVLAGIDWQGVFRAQSLRQDIAALTGTAHARSDEAIVPATRVYAAHLDSLSADNPSRLMIHAYLRYLGDLYGGQIIARIVREKVLPNTTALTFYSFAGVPDTHAFMRTFRDALDAAPASARHADELVDEAQYGYQLHAQLFEELAAK
ncbi:MAG: heme oxygenase (biliverdin-producing) [Gemmatimonas sp.]